MTDEPETELVVVETSRLEQWSHRVLPFIVFITAVVVMALAVLIQRNNENVEDLQQSTDELGVAIEDVNMSVDHLEDFVNEFEAAQADPNSQAQNEAISRAVQIVPEIKAILC